MKSTEITASTATDNHPTDFVDFHTHILPRIDDGAENIKTSYEMLLKLKQQNVTTVVLTPHFYTDRESMEDFLYRRNQAYQELLPIVTEIGLNVILGSELYFTDYVFNYGEFRTISINQKRYLLTEFPFSYRFNNTSLDKIARFIGNFSVKPVLAHIDRYPQLYKNRDVLAKLIDMGCIAQINLDSLTTGYLQRKAILSLIRDDLVHVVGTDCHNITSRPPDFKRGIDIIEKNLGKDCVDSLIRNSLNIIYK